MKVVWQELDGLIGYLREFIRVGELIQGRIDPVEEVADRDGLSAAAVGQGILRAEAGLGIKKRLGSFEIELGPAEIEVSLMQGEVTIETEVQIFVQYGTFLGG